MESPKNIWGVLHAQTPSLNVSFSMFFADLSDFFIFEIDFVCMTCNVQYLQPFYIFQFLTDLFLLFLALTNFKLRDVPNRTEPD